MFNKLKTIEARFLQIDEELADPGVLSDIAAYRKLMRERKALGPVVDCFRHYRKLAEEAEEAEALLAEEEDADMRALCEEECRNARDEMAKLEDELKVLLLPRDENDDRSVIVEIRAGTGGEEAALFAAELFRMYSMYAEAHGWKAETMNANETELGGFKEIVFSIEGDGAYARLKYESGTHRVQRVPETESGGRIHTSAVTVAVLPEAEDVEVEINPGDLIIDTYRSGGAGGQHVNKTDSAIRITHVPTGMVVECQDERSQHKNRERAMLILRTRLYEKKRAEQADAIATERRSQVGSGDRSERIRTYNFPQSRVTDHRIGLTLYKLDAILNGDLDEIVEALILNENAERLKNGEI